MVRGGQRIAAEPDPREGDEGERDRDGLHPCEPMAALVPRTYTLPEFIAVARPKPFNPPINIQLAPHATATPTSMVIIRFKLVVMRFCMGGNKRVDAADKSKHGNEHDRQPTTNLLAARTPHR